MARARKPSTGSGRLGWCLDGHHPACPGQVWLSMQKTNYRCGCDCHGTDERNNDG